MDAISTSTTGPAPEQARVLTAVGEHIGIRPGFCGGKPHVLGHRIKVKHVATWHVGEGLSPSEIVDRHPSLTLAQVHAALAYYYDHRAEIEAEVADEDRISEDLRARQPSLLERLSLRKADVPDDPLPPG